MQGLAPSTRRVYLSAQRRYLAFCRQDGRLGPSGLPLPADEQFLMRFCTFLADGLSHASIKVYLSAVRSLHIDSGLPDPLVTTPPSRHQACTGFTDPIPSSYHYGFNESPPKGFGP